MDFLTYIFWISSLIVSVILLTVSVSYLCLAFLSFFVFLKQKKNKKIIDESKLEYISLIIPFYNEENNIVDATYSFLKQKYSKKEIILVNDGSQDNGLQVIIDALEFEASRFKEAVSPEMRGKVKGFYKSKKYPHLYLIDKDNGGKADALNLGIACSHYDYFCSVDGDSILKLDALSKVMSIFYLHPKTIAIGTSISVINGNEVKDGEIKKFNLPKLLIEKLQFIEYLKVFQIGRTGFEFFRTNLIVSGAFGAFHKQSVINSGSYSENHLGEDMDLIIKLYKNNKEKKEIRFLSEPLCMTQVPYDWESLKRQRVRWQKGLIQSIFNNDKILIFKTSNFLTYGIVPYFILVDLIVPICFLIGHILLATGVLFGLFSIVQVLFLFLNSILFYTLLNILALLYREIFYPNKITEDQLFSLLFVFLIESIFYRQFLSLWRLIAMFEFSIHKKNIWGLIKRKRF